MSDWNVRRGIASTRLLCALGQEHGVPVPRCLAGTGIAAAQLGDPACEIDAAQEFRVIRNLLAAVAAQGLGPVEMGLAAGARYHLTTMGIWGFAMASSPTLRSALQVGQRYVDLTYSVNRVRLEEDGRHASIVLDESQAPADLGEFLVLRDMAAIQTLNRELLAMPLLPAALSLRYARPRSTALFHQTFGRVPAFGAAGNRMAFERAVLDAALPQANELTRQAFEDQCRQLLAKRRSRAGIAGRVRDRLLHTPGRMPDMEAVATELNMTSRHLRRLLAAEGAAFRALVDEVRQMLAEELLSTARMKMDEVAERLGYSERASFAHAFKRWKGVAPGGYRA
ncbi:MAG: AraC family transcriptional regulator [Nevskia sp.]